MRFKLFLILAFLVTVLNLFFLREQLNFGFNSDDWAFISDYLTLGPYPLLNIKEAWRISGAHFISRMYSIGILYDLFGANYRLVNYISQFAKILSALSLYPLIIVLFRSKLLAFLTSLFYSIIFVNLEIVKYATGWADFMAIFFLNIFLTVYLYSQTKRIFNFRLIVIQGLLFFLALGLNVVRTYPLILVVIFAEVVFYLKNKQNNFRKFLFIRLGVFFLPLIAFGILSPNEASKNLLNGFTGLFSYIAVSKNWLVIFAPISILGTMIIPSSLWPYLKTPTLTDLTFFVRTFVDNDVVYVVTSILLLSPLFKKPRVFSIALIISFILYGAAVFLLLKLNSHFFEPEFMNFLLIGGYVIFLAVFFYKEFLQTKNYLLLSIPLGIIFAFIFIIPTWLMANSLGFYWRVDGYPGVHAYLSIAVIGTSLTLAGVATLIFKKIGELKSLLYRYILIIPVVLGLFFYIKTNYLITQEFLFKQKEYGFYYKDQEIIQKNILRKINNFNWDDPAVFYFDMSDIGDDKTFDQVVHGKLYGWLSAKKGINFMLCNRPMIVSNFEDLSRLYQKDKNGFYSALDCGSSKVFYKLSNFYALKYKNQDFIDIKEEVVKRLY